MWGGGDVERVDIEQFKQQMRAQVLLKSHEMQPLYDAVVEAARAEEQRRKAEQEKALEVTDEQETPAE